MEEERGARASGVGGGDGGAAIVGGGKLAGAGETGPMGHQINLWGHRADAGEMASPKERFACAGMTTDAVAAMANGETSPVLKTTALEATKPEYESMGRKRG
jgi:hypothetical protein